MSAKECTANCQNKMPKIGSTHQLHLFFYQRLKGLVLWLSNCSAAHVWMDGLMQWGSSAQQIATWTSCLMSPKEIYCSKDWVFRVWVWAGEAVSPCPSLHLHLNMTIFNTRQQGTGPGPAMGPGLATHCQLCHQICLHILPSTLLLIPGISTSRYFTTNGHKHFLKIHFQRIHINCQKHHWGSGFLMMLPADLLHYDKSPDIHNTNIYTVGDTNIAQYIKILYIFSCREPQLRLDWLQT